MKLYYYFLRWKYNKLEKLNKTHSIKVYDYLTRLKIEIDVLEKLLFNK